MWAVIAILPFDVNMILDLSTECHAPGGGLTPIHYLYRYVQPNGVVILKLLI